MRFEAGVVLPLEPKISADWSNPMLLDILPYPQMPPLRVDYGTGSLGEPGQ
jgi:hypothetical protein